MRERGRSKKLSGLEKKWDVFEGLGAVWGALALGRSGALRDRAGACDGLGRTVIIIISPAATGSEGGGSRRARGHGRAGRRRLHGRVRDGRTRAVQNGVLILCLALGWWPTLALFVIAARTAAGIFPPMLRFLLPPGRVVDQLCAAHGFQGVG